MMVWLLFIIDDMGLFFYNKIGSIIPMVVLPTTEIIEPNNFTLSFILLYNEKLVKFTSKISLINDIIITI